MFYHVKELQFSARVSRPDVRFARLLLEQFGGENGELKAAMQYFAQAFSCRKPYPDKYDMLMDIATEEFSHLEIVGATIQMLLTGVSSELKNAADETELNKMLDGNEVREEFMHQSMINPHFYILTGGSPRVCDSQGVPWSGSYVDAMGDLTVDLRSNIAAESRAKMVYENLMKFTDDPYVKETLLFLMTREVAHSQMFEAALGSIQPNFPPGILESDPRYSNTYFHMSNGERFSGPWNEGNSIHLNEKWKVVESPIEYIQKSHGLLDEKATGTKRTRESIHEHDKKLSIERRQEIDDKMITEGGIMKW